MTDATSTAPAPEGDGPRGGASQTAVRSHNWFTPPTEPAGAKYISALIFAQLIFFIALLGPAIIGIGLKVQTIVPDSEKTSALGIVAGFGALCAVIGNALFGRLSDRTTSRWGRRRPWIVSGTIVMTLAFVVMALGNSVAVVTIGWCIAQFGANATFGPFLATIADQVPQVQRGSISALVGIAQNIGILGGTYVAQLFATQLVLLFVAPSILAIGAMALFAFVLSDQRLPVKPPRMNLAEWFTTFWLSPRKYPDFALAWWSRFLLTLATFMFTTFRLFYLQDRVGLSVADAPAAVTLGVLIYTIALIASGWVAGKISDRTGRRKVFVAGSTVLFAIGTGLLVHVDTVAGFYLVEAVLGLAYGIYVGVDLALVVDLLPNADDCGKDLGVFNIALSLPQTAAPVVGAVLLGVASADNQNYDLMLYSAAALAFIGALVIIPIKGVR